MDPLQITQILLISLLVVPTVITLGGVVYVSVRVVPVILRLAQQLIDNNTELTKVSKRNADGLESIQSELVRQTGVIEAQIREIQTQRFDFDSYQSLVNDGLHNQGVQLDANTNGLNALRATFEAFSQQFPKMIVTAIKDELQCSSLLAEFQALRKDVSRAVFQQQARGTGTIPVVSVPTVPSPAESAPVPSDEPKP